MYPVRELKVVQDLLCQLLCLLDEPCKGVVWDAAVAHQHGQQRYCVVDGCAHFIPLGCWLWGPRWIEIVLPLGFSGGIERVSCLRYWSLWQACASSLRSCCIRALYASTFRSSAAPSSSVSSTAVVVGRARWRARVLARYSVSAGERSAVVGGEGGEDLSQGLSGTGVLVPGAVACWLFLSGLVEFHQQVGVGVPEVVDEPGDHAGGPSLNVAPVYLRVSVGPAPAFEVSGFLRMDSCTLVWRAIRV